MPNADEAPRGHARCLKTILAGTSEALSDAVPLVGMSLDPNERQQVALVASVPLSAERWEPLAEGEIVVLLEGRVIRRLPDANDHGSGTDHASTVPAPSLTSM